MADLISTTEAKLHRGLAGVDGTLLGNLVSAASAFIEKYCNRSFSETEATEYYDGSGTEVLLLRNYPISEVSDVKIRENNSFVDYNPDYLTIDGRIGLVSIDNPEFGISIFPSGRMNIQFTYTYGTSSVPEPVKEACSIMVYYLYANSSAGARHNPALSREEVGSTEWESRNMEQVQMPKAVARLLGPYRSYGIS